MRTRVERSTGAVLTGVEAVNAPAEPETLTTDAKPSGIECILKALFDAYGDDAQDLQGYYLDRFFSLYRGNSSLMDYMTAFRLRYEAAEEHAALTINGTGLTHLLLKNSGLSGKFIDDLLLKLDGDRSQFGVVYKLLTRLAKAGQGVNDSAQGHIFHSDEYIDGGHYTFQYLTDYDGR